MMTHSLMLVVRKYSFLCLNLSDFAFIESGVYDFVVYLIPSFSCNRGACAFHFFLFPTLYDFVCIRALRFGSLMMIFVCFPFCFAFHYEKDYEVRSQF